MSPTEKLAIEEELKRRLTNLAILRERSAKYGLNVPLEIVHSISDEEQRIVEIEQRLSGETEEPSLASKYFSEGTKALICNDLWEARRYYQMTLFEDAFYPQARRQLNHVENRLGLNNIPSFGHDATISKPSFARVRCLSLMIIGAVFGAFIGGIFVVLFGTSTVLIPIAIGATVGVTIGIIFYKMAT